MVAVLKKIIRQPTALPKALSQRLSRFWRGMRQQQGDSLHDHDAEYTHADALEKHRQLYQRFRDEDLFNHPENKFGALLARYPQLRDTAVDIGSGAGWLSATLAAQGFARVVALEPSAAALRLACELFPQATTITWQQGFAETLLPNLRLTTPTAFFTGCVLSHLRDAEVIKICAALNAVAPPGSILGFSECWGKPYHRYLWHVRSQAWWQQQLAGWEIDFHGPVIENTPHRHKGFHAVKRA